MELKRSAGILLHPTSLPGGRLDEEAYRFVDWLARAGQSWWQVLPLGPPDEHRSPYRAASAFAAWPGLLAEPDAPVSGAEVDAFVAAHGYWIGHWGAFAGAGAVADQVRFEREWGALRAYALKRGIRIVGDVPIYVADNGADPVAWPEIFAHGEVAGAPPDALSSSGQHWGNPLYDWPALRRSGYRWWIERFRRTFELVDLTRIDHFRGFVSYWAIPEKHKTARHGRWRRGPGAELFHAVERELGALPVIAEDLGVITPAVERLRDELGFPGMVVMLWSLDGPASNPHRLENHRPNQVVYTSTHDTQTAAGWGRIEPWELIERALGSRARLAIVPVQDVLGLGDEARMNRPGESEGNWSWQLERGQLTDEHAARLRALTQKTQRTGK
jgi:4-alpha-glucanotransferase